MADLQDGAEARVTPNRDPFRELGILEAFWHDPQRWLEERGYLLRPRLRPGWKPSWDPSEICPIMFEDAVPLRSAHVVCDATRISDGAHVLLKIISLSLHPYEVDIAQYLTSESMASDPKNHCVPVYQVLKVPDNDDQVLLVMPLLRPWYSPPFDTVGEVVDFIGQLLRGLQFMHKNHVAHRDISLVNVMMDGSQFPNGWHPSKVNKDRQHPLEDARYFSRTRCPPKYYIIDFGISRRYDPNAGPPLEPPIHGGDRTVPEFQTSIAPCNPFPTDIYYAGNLIRERILMKYRGFGFMRSLVSDMVQDDPTRRPTIDEVVTEFEAIQKKLGTMKLHSRAGTKKEWFGPIQDFAHFFKSVTRVIRRVPPVPSRF